MGVGVDDWVDDWVDRLEYELVDGLLGRWMIGEMGGWWMDDWVWGCGGQYLRVLGMAVWVTSE